jgi:hypothetical protein
MQSAPPRARPACSSTQGRSQLRCGAPRPRCRPSAGGCRPAYAWFERRQLALRPAGHRAELLDRLACAAGKAKAAEARADGGDELDAIGPAFRATLEMLEWPRICEHLADFASTQCGKRACLQLSIPRTQRESERLLLDTRRAAAACCAGSPVTAGTSPPPRLPPASSRASHRL